MNSILSSRLQSKTLQCTRRMAQRYLGLSLSAFSEKQSSSFQHEHTMNLNNNRNFSTAVSKIPDHHYEALLAAHNRYDHYTSSAIPIGLEMTMDEAAINNNNKVSFDKILILISSCEGENKEVEKKGEGAENIDEDIESNEEYPTDPLLSRQGVGKALSIARLTAKHAYQENGLTPDLFVVNPLRRTTMTALLAFPQYAPGMIKEKAWICHPLCMEEANGKVSDFVCDPNKLKSFFRGIDYSIFEQSFDREKMNTLTKKPMIESKNDLLQRTDDFMNWIKQREERVITVASNSAWLQSMCGFSIDYHPNDHGSKMFKDGELRVVGIKFRDENVNDQEIERIVS